MTCVGVLESGDLAFVSGVKVMDLALFLKYIPKFHSSYISVLKRSTTCF